MTEAEWVEIGYSNRLIECTKENSISFADAFAKWFRMKQSCIKAQSLDRIEVTYNRYCRDTEFSERLVATITDSDVTSFLTSCISEAGNMTYKELARLMQVVRTPLVYLRDLECGAVPLFDWDKIKRNLPTNGLQNSRKCEFAVKESDVSKILALVMHKRIYPEKECACLLLCMNFYMGLRIGELAALTFQDFDFERNVIRVCKTETKCFTRDKNGERLGTLTYRIADNCKTVYSVREVPILPEVKYLYDKIRERHDELGYDSPYLCYDGADVVRTTSLDHTLRKLCRLCEVPYFNSHAIRKTFATRLHFHGVPTRVISDLLGHSELATTEHNYILNYRNNYEDAYKHMSQALNYFVAEK
ncbi:MAG: site-specific integrase [Clostridium sp.]|nr:site-specific integrase [Clostridium sp.]